MSLLGGGVLYAASPGWDAVSVKARSSALNDAACVGEGASPGRIYLPCHTLMALIDTAYIMFADGHRNPLNNAARGDGRKPVPIVGAPSWISSEHWEISAKAVGSPGQEMMRGPMLQAILEDRFKLKIHRETRQIPVYALRVAKGGLKLKPVQGACAPSGAPKPLAAGQADCTRRLPKMQGPNLTHSQVESLDQFAKFLDNFMDRPVVDKTGVAGLFDVLLEFAPDETTPGLHAAPADTATLEHPLAATIFTALQQQIGLKLEPAKGPGVFLVIDHVERPSGN
jgi:uncharacterized protein (TIGR03435 family)